MLHLTLCERFSSGAFLFFCFLSCSFQIPILQGRGVPREDGDLQNIILSPKQPPPSPNVMVTHISALPWLHRISYCVCVTPVVGNLFLFFTNNPFLSSSLSLCLSLSVCLSVSLSLSLSLSYVVSWWQSERWFHSDRFTSSLNHYTTQHDREYEVGTEGSQPCKKATITTTRWHSSGK